MSYIICAKLLWSITLLDGVCVSSTNSSKNVTAIKDTVFYPEMNFLCNGDVIKWIYGAVD